MQIKYFLIILSFLLLKNSLSYASNTLFQSLEKKQYASVDMNLEENELQNAMDAFEDFLNLPDTTKQSIQLKLSPNHPRSGMGFYVRKREKGDRDAKVFFQYHPALRKKFDHLAQKNAVVQRFFNHAHSLWAKSRDHVKKILLSLEGRFPGSYDRIFKTKPGKEINMALRFMKYDIHKHGSKLAHSHFDMAACTLALGESGPGLRIGSDEKNLKLVEQEKKKSIFFLSRKFEKMLGKKSTLKPGWHDVIPVNINPEKPAQRWAIVAFFDTHDIIEKENFSIREKLQGWYDKLLRILSLRQ